ncbi:MAG: hypothetical protein ACLFV7_08140 [Phycisphaerae bacterium]
MTDNSSKRWRRRHWWQHLWRGALFGALLLAAAYVTLPWWLPTGFIVSRLEEQLSEQAGVEVTIGSLSIRWHRVKIQGLAIASPAGHEGEPVAVAEFVRVPFDPLAYVTGEDIEWMEVEGLTVSAHINEEGKSNLAPLTALDMEPRPKRISLRDASVVLHLPDQPQLRLEIKDLQYLAGRVEKLGQLTLSAELTQQEQPAPLTFSLTDGRGDPQTVAAATVTFSNVDLQQLYLPELLGLPLKRLSGRLQGQLQLRMNPKAKVDRFHFRVAATNLDAQPVGGPQLEVIDRAGLELAAAWDPLADRLTLRSFRVQVPGSIRLRGSASIAGDILQGWEAIETLKLHGRVHPSRVAALVTGVGKLPGGLETRGPVGVDLQLEHQDYLVRLRQLRLDANAAAVYRNGRLLKPAGTPAMLAAEGTLHDRRRWLKVPELRLALGTATLRGNAACDDVTTCADLLGRALVTDQPLPLLGRALQTVGGRLEGSLTGLETFSRLHPAVGQTLGRLALDGPTQFEADLSATDAGRRFSLTVRMPEGTRFGIGERFVKPQRLAMSARLAATVPAPQTHRVRLENVGAALTLGSGAAVVLRNAGFVLPKGRLEGEFLLGETETLLTALPQSADWPIDLAGNTEGRLSWRPGDTPASAGGTFEADFTDLKLNAEPYYRKPAGRKANVRIEVDGRSASVSLKTANITADGFAAAQGELASLAEGGHGSGGLTLKVRDLEALLASSPWLAARTGKLKATGPATLDVSARREHQAGSVELSLNATDATLRWTGEPARVKKPGVPLALELAAVDSAAANNRRRARLKRLVLTADKVKLLAEGSATYNPAAGARGDRLAAPESLESLQAKLMLLGEPSENLTALLPELSEPLEQTQLAGRSGAVLEVALDEQGWSAEGTLDLRRASFRLGEFRKPADLWAFGDFALRTNPSVTKWHLQDLTLEVGDANDLPTSDGRRVPDDTPVLARLLADARGTLRTGEDGLPAPRSIHPIEWHVKLSADRIERLSGAWSLLQNYDAAGSLRLEAENRSGGFSRVDWLSAHSDGLTGRYRGREVSLGGGIDARDLRWSPRNGWRVGRLKLNDLELKAGPNHGWLMAELRSIPAEPAGDVTLLVETFDDADVLNWLGIPGPADPNEPMLSEAQVRKLRNDASQALATGVPWLKRTELDVNVAVDSLRSYDVSVRETYEIHHLRAVIRTHRGELSTEYSGILNGGRWGGSFRTDATETNANVAMRFTLDEVVGTPEIQPQLAKYFPGNTVNGLFTRTEQITAGLEESVAYFMDHRFPWTPVGGAKTIATDGMVTGRAAPEFIIRVFPSLDLASYEYRTMTGFAAYRPDGVAENDMIFEGTDYDVFMEGTTDTKGYARYKIGLLLGGSNPEWNHEFRQGRLPLLKVSGRIVSGEMLNRQVSFLWPNETLFEVALKNNIFYRAWLNQQESKAVQETVGGGK